MGFGGNCRSRRRGDRVGYAILVRLLSGAGRPRRFPQHRAADIDAAQPEVAHLIGKPTLPRSQLLVLAEIIRLITPNYPLMDSAAQAGTQDDVTRYVGSQIQSMPGFLRLPYKLTLLAFNWLALPLHRRTFRHLRPDAQLAYLALWSDGPFGPMRDFVKLIRSSALLVYFDHPLVMQRLEAERQQALRVTPHRDAAAR